MSDKEVLVYEEELILLRKIAETSSDMVKGRNWVEFREACGGQEKLNQKHENAVREYEDWHNCG